MNLRRQKARMRGHSVTGSVRAQAGKACQGHVARVGKKNVVDGKAAVNQRCLLSRAPVPVGGLQSRKDLQHTPEQNTACVVIVAEYCEDATHRVTVDPGRDDERLWAVQFQRHDPGQAGVTDLLQLRQDHRARIL